MPIVLILALLLGGGASLAAQSSLPGSPLYPVKVNLNENMAALLSFGAEGDAAISAEHALNRLEEAEELAVSGALSAEARADIQAHFEAHAATFEEKIARLEAEGNYQAAVDARTEFENSLKAHQAILVKLASDKSELRSDISTMLNAIGVEIVGSETARVRAEAAATSSTDVKATSSSSGTGSSTKINGDTKVEGRINVDLGL